MDLLLKIKELSEQLELEKEAHKKTQRTYDIKHNVLVKYNTLIFNQNRDLKNQFDKVDKFIKSMVLEGKINKEELSKFFTKKGI